MDPFVTLFNDYDPDRPADAWRWPFVYLHGKAEDLVRVLSYAKEWENSAPDIFVASKPMPPEAGEWSVKLYGIPAVAVIARRDGTSHLCGRVALLDDQEGLAHARRPEDWR